MQKKQSIQHPSLLWLLLLSASLSDPYIPYMYLETDYSTSDIEQINTRVTAFIEMLEEEAVCTQ